MKIVRINPDDYSVAYVEIDVLDLTMMQTLVEGMIEFVYAERWLLDDFIVNEEGMINRMRPWALGEHIYFGPAIMVTHHIDSEGSSTYSDAQVKIDHLWEMIQFGIKLQ